MRAPKGGGVPVQVAPAPAVPEAIAVDGAHVYWVELGGKVMKAPKSGGPPTQLASGQDNQTLTLDAQYVYWTSTPSNMGSLYRVPRAGGVVTTVASTGFSEGIAVDATHVYWATYGSGYTTDGSVSMLPVCCVQ